MRFLYKKSYMDDIRLFKHEGALFWYALLTGAVLGAPLVLDNFLLGELGSVYIWAIAGLATMLLVGFTGQISLGHAAFLGIGAYAHAYMIRQGVPFLLSVPLASAFTGCIGALICIPALRLHGLYLAIATLAFGAIVQEVFARWESVTGGLRGFAVDAPVLLGIPLDTPTRFYFVCLAVLSLSTLGVVNLLRSPVGRAWIAIRDSEIAAQSMGVNLAYYKTLSFAVSAFLAGAAGALFAHKVGYLAPDIFTPLLSIQLLMLVVVGGLGSVHGAVFGAIFIVLVPTLLPLLREALPAAIGKQPSLEPGLYGLILVLFLLFEPQGIYGYWRKIKFFFAYFPLYKRETFKRRRAYSRTERLR